MPCFPAGLQAPAKSFLRPGVWMPGLKNQHCHTESWKVDCDPTHCVEETLRAVEHLNEVEHPFEYYVNKVSYDEHWIQIFCYTPAGWLDVLEMTFVPFGQNSSLAKISSFSTGALPAWFPFGFLCDIALCWCPIVDGGNNVVRCQAMREALPFTINVLDRAEDESLIPRYTKEASKAVHSARQESCKDK